jgi:hypothetical protein
LDHDFENKTQFENKLMTKGNLLTLINLYRFSIQFCVIFDKYANELLLKIDAGFDILLCELVIRVNGRVFLAPVKDTFESRKVFKVWIYWIELCV